MKAATKAARSPGGTCANLSSIEPQGLLFDRPLDWIQTIIAGETDNFYRIDGNGALCIAIPVSYNGLNEGVLFAQRLCCMNCFKPLSFPGSRLQLSTLCAIGTCGCFVFSHIDS